MLDLKVYASIHPVDDQSNFHVPLAQLCTMFYAANRGENDPTRELLDFLVFRDHEADRVQSVESKFDRVLRAAPPEED